MKILITGHTIGIGAACEKIFNDYEVVGCSRSNGYDISIGNIRQQIIELARDCDVILLNAFSDEQRWAQHELLVDMFNAFAKETKTIVVISSNASDTWKGQMRKYPSYKKLVDHSAKQMAHLNMPCRVINIRPGYVATTRINKDFHKQAMSPESLATAIRKILELPSDVRPAEVTLLPELYHGKNNDEDTRVQDSTIH
tara:strand:+ start:348 stop:941 length:594 start_codon:yes stop_codon:yes gene_type:complete